MKRAILLVSPEFMARALRLPPDMTVCFAVDTRPRFPGDSPTVGIVVESYKLPAILAKEFVRPVFSVNGEDLHVLSPCITREPEKLHWEVEGHDLGTHTENPHLLR